MAPRFERVPEPPRIWETLVFCILSSQVAIEKARRATAQVFDCISFFDPHQSFSGLQSQLAIELGRPGVRHRFPQTKAKQISHSWFAFAQVHDEFHEYLASFDDERQARRAVMEKFPGLGLKQTSMLLRDIGYSRRLAIIDTHILWYFAKSTGANSIVLTPKLYIELEDQLLMQADVFRVEPNRLDSAIFAAVRTVKANTCMMQSA
ncbi:MAG: hypothetical protein K8F90_16905 [Hyphomicrobiales bacterium]|nr:hypothetical protein [Hyphomicrobiales bacterium]